MKCLYRCLLYVRLFYDLFLCKVDLVYWFVRLWLAYVFWFFRPFPAIVRKILQLLLVTLLY